MENGQVISKAAITEARVRARISKLEAVRTELMTQLMALDSGINELRLMLGEGIDPLVGPEPVTQIPEMTKVEKTS